MIADDVVLEEDPGRGVGELQVGEAVLDGARAEVDPPPVARRRGALGGGEHSRQTSGNGRMLFFLL